MRGPMMQRVSASSLRSRLGRVAALALALALALPACRAGGPEGAPARAASVPSPAAVEAPGGPVAQAAGRARVWPATPRRPVKTSFFGTEIVDDYAWLEDGASPEVEAWTDGQNAVSRAHLDGLPERAAVRERVAAILGKTSPEHRALRHVRTSVFGLKVQPPNPQPTLVVLPAERDLSLALERTVVDPNALDPTGRTTIDFFVPSPDGSLVAVSLSRGGSESGDVHVFDVATGKERGDVVARVHGGTAGGSLAWKGDGSGFWYTRYPRDGERPEAELGFHQEVWFHELGRDVGGDVYAFGKGLPKIAEIELHTSDDGRAVLAEVSNGDGGEIEHHVLQVGPGARASVVGPWTRLSRFSDELAHATFGADGKVYAIARKEAPRGKVVAFAPPFDRPAETVLGEADGVLEDLAVTRDALYVVELVGGPSRVRRVPLDPRAEPLAREAPRSPPRGRAKAGKGPRPAAKAPATAPPTLAPGARGGLASAELPLPAVASVSGLERVGDDLLLRLESFTTPPAWHRYRASEHRLVRTPLAKAPAVDLSDVEVTRQACTSRDGTRVPLTVLKRRGTKPDGDRPALLTGYGGFGLSRKPRMRAWYRVWLDAGGIVAEANLRGGGELGEAWHRAGMLTRKQNVFDDFAACARALVDLGLTRAERLAAHGRSNGGLLVGAALVQHPELFRAAVAEVGIYDMLRAELSPNGAFNVTEYGTVKDEAEFRALHGYSPLHHVADGTVYPAVLFTTGANDPRVDPYHSRKMTARMQAASASERPVLLRASRDTGHGMGTPLAIEIEELSDVLAFLMHEVGATASR